MLRPNWLLRDSLILRQTIGDFIVVALLRDENMQLCVRLGGLIERPHRDSEPVLCGRVEEHRTAADRTKSATNFCRGLIPADVLGADDLHGTPWRIRSDGVMPGEFSTLYAVTGIGRLQFTGNRELHRTADARAALHNNLLLAHLEISPGPQAARRTKLTGGAPPAGLRPAFLPAEYSQKHTDRHQNETDRPLQRYRMRRSAEQAELIYGGHRNDLAQKYEGDGVADAELWRYPRDAEDVKGDEHAAQVEVERDRRFREWPQATLYNEKEDNRNRQRYQKQDRRGERRASIPGAQGCAQRGHNGNTNTCN